MVDSHVVAWAAGLFDGEGNVKIEKRKGRSPASEFLLRVSLGMTHKPTIERLAEIFPACRFLVERKKENYKDVYRVWWNGKKGECFLRDIRPYLVTKADEADIAFAFQAAPKGPAGTKTRESCYLALCKRQHKFQEGTTEEREKGTRLIPINR
jgi:hypothetical protein